MSREIKFRVFHGNEMLYVNLANELQLNFGINDGWALWEVNGEICNHKQGKLMQYTGLKDRNGVEIYEGDIAKHIESESDDDPHFEEIGQVIYEPTGYVHKCITGGLTTYWLLSTQFMEVIGNIYENPNLLEYNIAVTEDVTEVEEEC